MKGILYRICLYICVLLNSIEGAKGDQSFTHHFDSTEGSFDGGHHIDDILKEFDDYGSTPPRTRISRRQRERRQREKEEIWYDSKIFLIRIFFLNEAVESK